MNERHPSRAALQRVRLDRRLGQHAQHGVQQVTASAPVQRADRHRLSHAQLPQLSSGSLAAGVVDLVGGEQYRLPRALQDSRDGGVLFGDTDCRINHEHDRVGGRNSELGLLRDPTGHAPGIALPSAGVEHREPSAVPGGVVRNPIAGDAGYVLDHGFPAADHPVDECRLADVGTSDDGNHG